ncbi:hypothetical protein B0H11DRAFT_164798 [Mycena galericulata]|nr:hypothetical protein B0H11DRAFT_164798 [Mycena galericulata]
MSLAALNLSPLSALTALVGIALWDLCLSHRCLYIDGGNMSDESSDSDSEPEVGGFFTPRQRPEAKKRKVSDSNSVKPSEASATDEASKRTTNP